MELSTSSANSKKDASVAIQELQPDTGEDRAQSSDHVRQATWHERFARHVRRFMWRFFPFVGEPPPAHFDDVHRQASFPWLGLSCLVVSLLTLVISFILFYFINHRVQFQSKYLKPASWLSVLISVNSIALHIALSEGVTTAWWYKASRVDVTLQELHETWTMGTSTVAVLLSGKKFNYVAMATIFVATVPLNGFLLQNTVSLIPSTDTRNTTLHVPVLQQLPLGYSADMTNGSIESMSAGLSSLVSSVESLYYNNYPPGVFYPVGDFDTIGCARGNDTGYCKANVTIAGFDMDCTTDMTETYDLRPSQHTSKSPYSVTVFSSSVTWNVSEPNTIGLEMIYKPNSTCQGSFERWRCHLRAASMSLPIQINSDRGFTIGTYYTTEDAQPVIKIDTNSTVESFVSAGTLPIYPDEGMHNTTYGGIAQWLGQRFNGSIDWTLNDGSWSSNRSGFTTNKYIFNDYVPIVAENGSIIDSLPFDPKPDNTSWCNNTYSGLDSTADDYQNSPVYEIFYTLNEIMLGASTNMFTAKLYDNQTFTDIYYNLSGSAGDEFYAKALRDASVTVPHVAHTQDVLLYSVRYAYWGASVAVTVCVILMILPLFYGFWRLDRRATLSPFETAAAFRAPGLVDADMKKGTAVLLKEIGKRPVHADRPGSSTTSVQPLTEDTRNHSA